MLSFKSLVFLTSALFCGSSIAGYTLTHDYSGDGFFDGFDFFSDKDPTNGFVKYVDDNTANSAKLAGLLQVQASSYSKRVDGQASLNPAYMGVDFQTKNPTAPGRSSIRISSKDSFNHGLFIADIQHMPAGTCGLWPAYWLLANPQKYTWPAGGEIDILEGVNTGTSNQMTLHTSKGCTIPQSGGNGTGFKGSILNADCISGEGGDNTGCGILDSTTPGNFGPDFNAAGGGIFATEWTSSGIKMWFFGRNSSIPSDLIAATALTNGSMASNNNTKCSPAASVSLDLSQWGLPVAYFPSTSCPIDDHFKDMQIIFNTALCGDWAGKVWDQEPTCKDKAPTCQQYVAQNGADFAEAYWAIRSVRVFQNS